MIKILTFLFLFFIVISQLPSQFAYLKDISPTIIEEIRYFGFHNFVGRRITGYNKPKCILTRSAATKLHLVQNDLFKLNLTLKVYDCYRPVKAVQDFVKWAKELDNNLMKEEFYKYVKKENLFKEGYIAERSGHSRGSTIDLTIVPLPVPNQETYQRGDKLRSCTLPRIYRFRDNTIDMGTGYDCFNVLSHTNNSNIEEFQKRNRYILKNLMDKFGFTNYALEWWHYTLRNEPFKDQYFDFNIE